MGQSASKEKFRESVTALIQVDVSADDAEFWDELWKIPSSAEEVFELLPPAATRQLRDERFENLATLFTQAVAQLCQIVETPYSIYFDQALNCVRVLTRILPFVLEKGDLGDADENVEQLCWGTDGGGADEKIGIFVGVGRDAQQPATTLSEKLQNKQEASEDQEPLALLVVHAAMHMLFLPQFTCDFYEDNPQQQQQQSTSSKAKVPAISKKESKQDKELLHDAGLRTKRVDWGVSLEATPASIVWAPGIGVRTTSADGRKYDKNRIEVLRLILTAACDPLFSPADEYNPLASRWLAVLTAADAPNSICLFYSLLNTVLGYDPRTLNNMTAGFSEGTHLKLVELSSQVLCVLLDCGLPGSPDPTLDQNGMPCVDFETASKGGFNIFRTLLARISTGRELTFVYQGFVRLLKSVYEADSNFIMSSSMKLGCYQELLVLFWKFLEENPIFMPHILTRCDITEIVVPICFLMYKCRRDAAHVGLIHIATFVLLKLSGERSFGVSLNRAFTKKLPTDLPLFHGCHTDLLVITLHKLVVNGAYKLVPLYSCWLTVISNISPYWKSMSLVAAVKLVNLFELFSSPKFLYSGEYAYRHLALLLEVFNNIIQYQYHGNTHLVYAILRRKDAFGQLASLNLVRAQAQCHKVYGEKVTVQRDVDAAAHKVSLETKGIPNVLGGVPDRRMHLRSNGGVDDDDSDASQVSSIVGTPFQPTAEWLEQVHASLPMETVARLLQHLVPVVDDIVASKSGVVDEQHILNVLNEITMVGLLPVPHVLVLRKYQPNQYTALWFSAYLWGVIFLKNQDLPLFDGTCVELFNVAMTEEEDD